MSTLSPQQVTVRDRSGTTNTLDANFTRRPSERRRSFWQQLKSKTRRTHSPSADEQATAAVPKVGVNQKRTLAYQLSTESSPDVDGNRYRTDSPLHTSSTSAVKDSDEALGPPMRRTRSLRERTAKVFNRVTRRVSRRRPRSSPSPRGGTPSSLAPSGSELFRHSPSLGRAADAASSSSLASPSNTDASAASPPRITVHALAYAGHENQRVTASRGEATAEETTDSSAGAKQRGVPERPEIEVTDSSLADISAAVQQLTNRTQDESVTPIGSPVSRRRAYTSDANKNLASLLAPKKWRSRNRLLCEWVPNDEDVSAARGFVGKAYSCRYLFVLLGLRLMKPMRCHSKMVT